MNRFPQLSDAIVDGPKARGSACPDLLTLSEAAPYNENFLGQVAQSVERSPEKAGVGGSIPSLATTF